MAGTIQGSPDGPKYIYGKLNSNYQGSHRAAVGATSGSKESAVSDFAIPEDDAGYDDLVSIDDADNDDSLSEINFDSEDDDVFRYREPHVLTEDSGHRVLVEKDGDDVTMHYEFEDNPRSSIMSMLEGDIDQAEEFEYDPFGSDGDIITDEYYEAYSTALENFAHRQGLDLDQDVIENDYGRMSFYSSVDMTEDPDMTLGQMHDRFNGAYNSMSYRLEDSIQQDFADELEKRGISTSDLAEKLEGIRDLEE